MPLEPSRTLAELRELQELTGDQAGAQRLCWTPSWLQAREICAAAIEETTDRVHRLPSGPLHDAAEMVRAGLPTAMIFVQSLNGLSHTKQEDTRPEHLEMAVRALDRATTRGLEWAAGKQSPDRWIRA